MFKPEDISKVIADEDYFGHELRVGHVFEEALNGSQPDLYNGTMIDKPQHGGTYNDPVTNKPRQFDYRCRIHSSIRPMESAHSLWLAAECKNLNEASPLVVCGRERTAEEAYYTFIESTFEQSALSMFSVKRTTESYNHLYKEGAFVGKSLLRLKNRNNKLESDSDSDVYDKWSQAMASSEGLANSSTDFAAKYSRTRFCSLVIPVVVVPNGSLWIAQYASEGSLQGVPRQVEECEFFVERVFEIGKGSRIQQFAVTHIHFFTINGFRDFVRKFLTERRIWERVFPASAIKYSL